MHSQSLLETYLKQLRLPTFLQNYQTVAQDAARTDLPYERYLLALCEAEIQQREVHRVVRAIAQARFPIRKDLASFDFSLVQGVTKQRVLELAQGGYIAKAETIILVGNPGLGKTHVALGLGSRPASKASGSDFILPRRWLMTCCLLLRSSAARAFWHSFIAWMYLSWTNWALSPFHRKAAKPYSNSAQSCTNGSPSC